MGASWEGDLSADRRWSSGAVYAHGGHKDPRGYLGVDSNDGARERCPTANIFADSCEGGCNPSARSLIAGLQRSLAPL